MIANPAEILTIAGQVGAATADAGLINLLHKQAERLVKKYLGYNVEKPAAPYAEYYPEPSSHPVTDPLVNDYQYVTGDEYRALQLKQLPVRSIVSVNENDAAWTGGGAPAWGADSLVPAEQYQLDVPGEGEPSWSGLLWRNGGAWTGLERTVKVVYEAGLTPAELSELSEFAAAVAQTVVVWFLTFKSWRINPATGSPGGVVTGESLAGWSVSYSAGVAERLLGMTTNLPPSAAQLLEGRVRMGQYLS